jgi:uncharacterized protein (DUF2126 family)
MARGNGIPANRFPRWSLGLYWRKDGEPIWTDTELVADEQQAGPAYEMIRQGICRASWRSAWVWSRISLCPA